MDDEVRARSYVTPPTRVERRGGRSRAIVVGVLVVAFVAVAIAKPWGGGASDLGDMAASPSVAPAASRSASERPAAIPAARPVATPRVLHDPDVGLVGSDAALLGPLVARLSEHSGDWGIGSGAWRPDSQLPWIDWRPAVPIAENPADRRAVPDCRDLPVLGGGIVVAITAPGSIVPDWTVETLWFGRDGRPVVAPVRQVSPPGNRGIAYLVRSDGHVWPTGAYRFRVSASKRVLDLEACLSWT